jgi:hypothetical protein
MKSSQGEYEEKKKNTRAIGLVLLIVGIFLFILGIANIYTVFTTPTDWGNFAQHSSNMMGRFIIGGGMTFLGFFLIGIGYQLYAATHIRGFARFAATETAPATKIMTEAIASGLSRGFSEEGGSPFSSTKEVIKLKCRNCGYLETEDADFCSKCGERI